MASAESARERVSMKPPGRCCGEPPRTPRAFSQSRIGLQNQHVGMVLMFPNLELIETVPVPLDRPCGNRATGSGAPDSSRTASDRLRQKHDRKKHAPDEIRAGFSEKIPLKA